ncbi:hypothetical protein M0R04_03940 [Candidatus Dojkabacteria bacterium]|jgi:hypothetical protein|nr:hypothetical protein [Candidatus Dojkabacteria bacterium]
MKDKINAVTTKLFCVENDCITAIGMLAEIIAVNIEAFLLRMKLSRIKVERIIDTIYAVNETKFRK